MPSLAPLPTRQRGEALVAFPAPEAAMAVPRPRAEVVPSQVATLTEAAPESHDGTYYVGYGAAEGHALEDKSLRLTEADGITTNAQGLPRVSEHSPRDVVWADQQTVAEYPLVQDFATREYPMFPATPRLERVFSSEPKRHRAANWLTKLIRRVTRPQAPAVPQTPVASQPSIVREPGLAQHPDVYAPAALTGESFGWEIPVEPKTAGRGHVALNGEVQVPDDVSALTQPIRPAERQAAELVGVV